MPFDENILVAILILVLFLIGTSFMVTRKMPALLVLPLMAIAIVAGAAVITGQIDFGKDVLGAGGVIAYGAGRLGDAIIAAFFGGFLSFIMQKSGVAQSLVKNAAELIGDNPLAVSLFTMTFVALLFTSIGGLGAVIMVAIVFLPMLATVGVPPVVAGGIMLIGLSLGGLLNPQNWLLWSEALGVPVVEVQTQALTVVVLMFLLGTVFICIELLRSNSVRSYKSVAATMLAALAVAGILAYAFYRGGVESHKPFTWQIFNADFRRFASFGGDGDVESVRTAGNEATFLVAGGNADRTVTLVAVNEEETHSEDATFKVFLPEDLHEYEALELSVASTVPIKVRVQQVPRVQEAEEDREVAGLRSVGAFGRSRILIPFKELGTNAENLRGLVVTAELPPQESAPPAASTDKTEELYEGEQAPAEISPAQAVSDAAARPEMSALPATITLTAPRFIPIQKTPVWRSVLQLALLPVFAYVLFQMLWDLRSRVRRWRQQVVRVNWYAYLIPAIPLILILVYQVDILAAFLIGFVYAVLATLRPGSMSMTVQCMIQGAATVLPAVLLMLGIGILLTAVLGPPGWSEAHLGAKWPVIAAMEPLLKTVTPSSRWGYVAFFGLLTPLALYRGPLNAWGLGFGIGALLLAGDLPDAAVMAMLMTVGQIQGVCDPTNTHNVWLANELRVDVNTLMWRTIPYIWVMVFLGLTISAIRFF